MGIFRDPVIELAVSLFVLAVVVAIAVYVIGRVRRETAEELAGRSEEDRHTAELMSRFRELHCQGGLSDEEYRTIKTRLADKLLGESRDTDETG